MKIARIATLLLIALLQKAIQEKVSWFLMMSILELVHQKNPAIPVIPMERDWRRPAKRKHLLSWGKTRTVLKKQ